MCNAATRLAVVTLVDDAQAATGAAWLRRGEGGSLALTAVSHGRGVLPRAQPPYPCHVEPGVPE